MPDRSKRYPMPVEPFAEIIERAILERTVEGLPPDDKEAYQRHGCVTPLEAVTEEIARVMHMQYQSVYRRVYEIRLRKVRTIKLDMADAIVCAFDSPWFWQRDERVADLYEAVA